jgi:hypothetical protein
MQGATCAAKWLLSGQIVREFEPWRFPISRSFLIVHGILATSPLVAQWLRSQGHQPLR